MIKFELFKDGRCINTMFKGKHSSIEIIHLDNGRYKMKERIGDTTYDIVADRIVWENVRERSAGSLESEKRINAIKKLRGEK